MIDFDAKTHTYKKQGKRLYSVSELTKFATGKTFDGIPDHILQNAREFGENVHLALELCVNTGIVRDDLSDQENRCIRQGVEIIDPLQGKKAEIIVSYKDIYAGTVDLVTDTAIYDYKTSYKLDKEWLAWQLGYYKMALEYESKDVDYKTIAIHLQKKKDAKIVEIEPKTKKELIENIYLYNKENGLEDGEAKLIDKHKVGYLLKKQEKGEFILTKQAELYTENEFKKLINGGKNGIK